MIFYLEAICDASTLPTWSGYETLSVPGTILSGQTVSYTCSQTQSMIPVGSEAWDPDSNSAIELTCIDGAFVHPPGMSGTPPPCVESSSIICNSRPEPPENTNLEYVNIKLGENADGEDINKNKYRPGEKAYYVCTDPAAIIKPNGTNLFDIPCQEGVYNFDTALAEDKVGWPECFLEPICDSLPDPPSNTHMIKATKGDSVRLGDYVKYECELRDLYWETPKDVRHFI